MKEAFISILAIALAAGCATSRPTSSTTPKEPSVASTVEESVAAVEEPVEVAEPSDEAPKTEQDRTIDALRRENQRLRRALVQGSPDEPVIDLSKVVDDRREVLCAAENGRVVDDGGFWLTTGSKCRHNSKCRYYKMGRGRPCDRTEGRPCRKCGG